MSKVRNILIICIIVIVALVFFIVAYFTGRIPMNDPDTTGNTAGNLNNGGYFCESDGKVYFANAYDNYNLYSMNPDETDLKKLSSNYVSSINAGGNYLYYYMESGASTQGSGLGFLRRTAGIYRSTKRGSRVNCLDRTYAITMQLCGNYLYYQDYNTRTGTVLSKIKIDKTDKSTVADYVINPSSYVDGAIYYGGTQNDHALYRLNTNTDKTSSVWRGNVWDPVYYDYHIYYMDVENNYRLCRYSLSDQSVQVLTDDRVDAFNVYEGYIYYQKNSTTEPALKRMMIDGSRPEIVAEGNYENINITSQYVYFNSFDEPTPVYHTSTFGSVSVGTFDSALSAAADEMN